MGLLKPGGTFGLVATNTISQGDTREAGLDQILGAGGQIYAALPSMKWPGDANLEVAVTHVYNGQWKFGRQLSGRCVETITAFLDDGSAPGVPLRLNANLSKSFQGSIVLGLGFVLEPQEAEALIALNPRNTEVLFPYLNGEDLNSRPDQSSSRWVINFFDRSEQEARSYPDCWKIIEGRVRPERQRKNENGEYILRKPLPQRYWQHADKRPALYVAIADLAYILVACRVTKYITHSLVPTKIVYDVATTVIIPEPTFLSNLESSIYDTWVRQFASSLETRVRYTNGDCFETFPFPRPNDERRAKLDHIGEAYHEHRRRLMLARQIGLTKAYNLFHAPASHDADIAELRRLHVEMDNAVRDAYSWTDLELGHDFHGDGKETRFTLAPDAKQEVLRRLLALNHARAEEEAEAPPAPNNGGAGRKRAGAGKKAATSGDGNGVLIDPDSGLFEPQTMMKM